MRGACREVEAKLCICGEAPARVADRVAATRALGGHALRPARALDLRDVYFDTPDRALSRARVSVRVRTRNGAPRLTFKGPERELAAGAVSRDEIERPWSRAALAEILTALRAQGIVLPAPRSGTGGGGTPEAAVAALTAHGLRVIQDRKTERRARDAVDAAGRVRAELAIDCVHHRFGAREARLYELEVEARGSGGAGALRALVEALEAEHGAALRRWPHNKLATGLALAALLEGGGAERLVTPGGDLRGAAYTEIDRTLREVGA